MMEKCKEKKGITLIALTITIIVLIILAGIAVNSAVGKQGIFTEANAIKQNEILAQQVGQNKINELKQESVYTAGGVKEQNDSNGPIIDGLDISSSSKDSITVFATVTEQESGIAKIEYSCDGGTTWEEDTQNNQATSYTFSNLVQGVKYIISVRAIDKSNNVSDTVSIEGTTTLARIASKIGGDIISNQYNVMLRDNDNNILTVPAGFKIAKDSSPFIFKGVVIEDINGNQYVWVEVPMTTDVYPTAGLSITGFSDAEYTAVETDLHTYTSTYRNGTSFTDTYYSDAQTGLTSAQYSDTKKAMLKSIYQNEGFWVGRYEAGIATNRTSHTTVSTAMVTKANQYPYTYVTCSEAETLAKAVATSSGYHSSLLFGVQWDLVLRYLESKGASQADLNEGSTSWGNYYNNAYGITGALAKYSTSSGSSWTATPYSKTASESTLLTTGATSTFSKNNIYDIAGNVWEWTMEEASVSSYPCTFRGGYYGSNGSVYPASYRLNTDTGYSRNNLGFRVALY